jgi:hypothetical protein
MTMSSAVAVQKYKFQKLEVYQLALQYLDLVYLVSKRFPSDEKYNLTSQIQKSRDLDCFEHFGRVDRPK